jgi:hypothetical protein
MTSMQPVEPTKTNVGDHRIWRELIQLADGGFEPGAKTTSWPLSFSSPPKNYPQKKPGEGSPTSRATDIES